jgi:hypothetical protein
MVADKINRTCQYCGGPVAPPRSPSGSHPFCSKRCSARARPKRDVAKRFWAKVDKTDGCWLWRRPAKNGYGVFYFNGSMTPAHRIAYQLTYGPIPAGFEVCHRCDVGGCQRPDHLFLGTHGDNMRDMAQKGRSASGDRSHSRLHPERLCRGTDRADHKLTEDDVRAIRIGRANGVPYSALAARFGVSQGTIVSAATRKSWKHVV